MTEQFLKKVRPGFKGIFKEKEFWILVLLWIVFCYRPLFLNETFFFRDLSYHFFPQKQLFVNFLHSKEWPLWDLYLHGGQPYFADVANAVLYPTNLLYMFLPLVKAFNLTIVLHFVGCSIAIYLFCRINGFQQSSSFIAGILYGFCGYMLSLGDHLTRFFAMPHIPLIFMFWHLYMTERKKRWFLLAVLFGVIQVLPGAPEVNIITLLSLLAWTICYPYQSPPFLQRVFRWGVLGACILGIASVQILPTLEMISQSSRGTGMELGVFGQWSLHPGRLPETVFPQFCGYTDRLPYNVYYWGGDLGDKGYSYFLSIYFGFVTIALALVGAVVRNENRGLVLRVRRLLLLLLVAALLLSFGRFLPFFRILYQSIPIISMFRYPIKFLLAGLFPLALLAGYGSEVLFGRDSSVSQTLKRSSCRRFLFVLWAIAIILIIFMATFWFSKEFAEQVQIFFFNRSSGEIAHQGLRFSFAHASAIWLLFTLLYQSRLLQYRRWQPWGIACILIIDLLVAGRQVNPIAPGAFFTQEPELVAQVRQEIGGGKLFRTPDPLPRMFHFPVTLVFPVPPDHIMWFYRWQREMLRKYLAASYKIPVIFHDDYDRLAQLRLMKLKKIIYALPWEKRLPLLSAAGVTLVLSSEEFDIPGIQHLTEVQNWSDMQVHLYKNMRAIRRTELVQQWKIVSSDEEAIQWMLKPNYDPRVHVILQKPEKPIFSLPLQDGQEREMDLSVPRQCTESFQSKITPRHLMANSSSYSVSTTCDGYLVFAEQFYPGWHVTVDGKPVSLLRANFAFSAIFLSAGEHEIHRYYRPDALLIGLICSLGSLCILIVITYKRYLL